MKIPFGFVWKQPCGNENVFWWLEWECVGWDAHIDT